MLTMVTSSCEWHQQLLNPILSLSHVGPYIKLAQSYLLYYDVNVWFCVVPESGTLGLLFMDITADKGQEMTYLEAPHRLIFLWK
jgi:hypothetical protein